jgi:DNA replication protein DnaC
LGENNLRLLNLAAISRTFPLHLLIIDDMGLKALPKHSGEYLLEVVMRRYENRSTIMTSNRPLEEWGKLPGPSSTGSCITPRSSPSPAKAIVSKTCQP